jgi:hypothetical protein
MIKSVGKIINGQFLPYEEALWHNELSKLNGKEVLIDLTPLPLRSINQNAYYWGTVVYMIYVELKNKGMQASDLGSDTGELKRTHVHESLKHMFAKREKWNAITEEVELEHTDTKTMTTIEFTNYINLIRQWSAEELGLEIPDPNEQN